MKEDNSTVFCSIQQSTQLYVSRPCIKTTCCLFLFVHMRNFFLWEKHPHDSSIDSDCKNREISNKWRREARTVRRESINTQKDRNSHLTPLRLSPKNCVITTNTSLPKYEQLVTVNASTIHRQRCRAGFEENFRVGSSLSSSLCLKLPFDSILC